MMKPKKTWNMVTAYASEHASRLTTMQRAEHNIKDMLSDLKDTYHRERQNAITAELMDITAGFEALQE